MKDDGNGLIGYTLPEKHRRAMRILAAQCCMRVSELVTYAISQTFPHWLDGVSDEPPAIKRPAKYSTPSRDKNSNFNNNPKKEQEDAI